MEVKSRDCLEWKEKNYFIEGVGVEKPKQKWVEDMGNEIMGSEDVGNFSKKEMEEGLGQREGPCL